MNTTTDIIAGVLARLALNYSRNFTEDDARGMVQIWSEQLAEHDARDVHAAVTAILADTVYDRFPTVAQFRDEVQIQGRDRLRREQPAGHAGAGPHDAVKCTRCGDTQFVIVQEAPLTVRPCECDERRYELWKARHYQPGHICAECSSAMDRAKGGGPRGRKGAAVPERTDPARAREGIAHAQQVIKDF